MRYAFPVFFLWISQVHGQTLKLPAEVKGDVGSFIAVKAETDGSVVKFYPLDAGLSVFPADLLTDKKTTVVVAARSGRYRIMAWTAKGDVPSDAAVCVVIIGDVPPTPPTPPTPPVPPPVPPPGPSPIPAQGFRVLILYETKELSKLSGGQRSVLYSTMPGSVRDYLNLKCVKDSDNPSGAWRIWDADVNTAGETALWQGAVKRARETGGFRTPWLIISNGTTGFEGPMPDTVEATLTLLRKYGG